MKVWILAAAAAAVATAALAHDDRRGGEDNHRPAAGQAAISQERAVAIAREQGVATVREVELDDGVWEVEGRTAEGRKIEVDIDPRTGAVLKRELD